MIFAKPWLDALIVLFVVLLFFGPKRLPAFGRSLGEGMREFKDSITGKSNSDEELPQSTAEATQPPVPAAPVVPADPPATQQPPAQTPPEAAPPPVASSEPRN